MNLQETTEAMLRRWLADLCDCEPDAFSFRTVSGGCIHTALRADWVGEKGSASLFVKLAGEGKAPLLNAEKQSLYTLKEHAPPGLKVPDVLGSQEIGEGFCALALEWLAMTSSEARTLGPAMTQLYKGTEGHFSSYGFPTNNFIGATQQINTRTDSWPDFFAERRIKPQLEWARARGYDLPSTEKLSRAVRELLSAKRPAPPSCLLHGDLWSGNAGMITDGQPVIFDPACYFGDPWADLAISELFGGFSPSFFTAVSQVHPRPAEDVMETYKAYHLLNHLNLFGESYLAQALRSLSPALRFS